jgi:hypothetical protein
MWESSPIVVTAASGHDPVAILEEKESTLAGCGAGQLLGNRAVVVQPLGGVAHPRARGRAPRV